MENNKHIITQRTDNIINNQDYCPSITPSYITVHTPKWETGPHLHPEFISMRKNTGVWGHAKKLG